MCGKHRQGMFFFNSCRHFMCVRYEYILVLKRRTPEGEIDKDIVKLITVDLIANKSVSLWPRALVCLVH